MPLKTNTKALKDKIRRDFIYVASYFICAKLYDISNLILGGMFVKSYATNYAAEMPDITINSNCDTILAINLSSFNLDEQDEFVFTIKNYDYADSSYVFIYKCTAADANTNGEVLFKVPSITTANIKHGAFYSLGVLTNAFNRTQETIYKKLTEKGNILVDYGMQDLTVKTDFTNIGYEIIGMHLEPADN